MKRFILSIWIAAFCFTIPLSAQQKKKANIQNTQTAEQLILQYNFSEAARQLQKEINAARAAGKSTTRLEDDLRRANMGEDMLRGTERIEFVDSFKVERNEVLRYLHLSPESGRFVMMKKEVDNFKTKPESIGKCGHVNELNNRIIFPAKNSTDEVNNLCEAYRSGETWASSTPLKGMQNSTAEQDFPFMMPDGVTLYYAAQGSESLGGYDIFITRYNAETKQYLKAENIGMPFNSPANDYLMAIDEINNLGWLVTDRGQKADSVCIYVFVPNSTREVYELTESNLKQITKVAQLHSISETQINAATITAAKKRLANVLSHNTVKVTAKNRRYIINDQTIYTDISQFRNATARQFARQADEIEERITELESRQDLLRRSYAQGKRTNPKDQTLSNVNKSIATLYKQYNNLCKNMRKAEIETIKSK